MILTSIILSVLALALSMWMGRRNPVRSSGLTAGMLVLLVLSPLILWMPKIHIDMPWVKQVAVPGGVADASGYHFMHILVGVYGVGCAILLGKLISHFLVAKRWCEESVIDQNGERHELLEQCSEQLDLTKLAEVKFSVRVSSPVITGLLHPVLLLPMQARDWTEETLKMVMLHELGHVQRYDLWANLAGQIACALHWFNPIVWILRKRLTNECEYACDAHVISCGAHPGSYINALCDVAESCQDKHMLNSRSGHSLGSSLAFSAALSMASKASLRNRVENMLEKKPGVSKCSSFLVMSILTISASAALAINLVRPDMGKTNQLEQLDSTDQVAEVSEKEVDLRFNANPFPGDSL